VTNANQDDLKYEEVVANVFQAGKVGSVLVVSRYHSLRDLMHSSRWVELTHFKVLQIPKTDFWCYVLGDWKSIRPSLNPAEGDPWDKIRFVPQCWKFMDYGQQYKYHITMKYSLGAIHHLCEDMVLKAALLNLATIHLERKDFRTATIFALCAFFITKSRDAFMILAIIAGNSSWDAGLRGWFKIAESTWLNDADMTLTDELYCTLNPSSTRLFAYDPYSAKNEIHVGEFDRLVQGTLMDVYAYGGTLSPLLHIPNQYPITKTKSRWSLLKEADVCVLNFEYTEAIRKYYSVVTSYSDLQILFKAMTLAAESKQVGIDEVLIPQCILATTDLGSADKDWKLRRPSNCKPLHMSAVECAENVVSSDPGDKHFRQMYDSTRKNFARLLPFINDGKTIKDLPSTSVDGGYAYFKFLTLNSIWDQCLHMQSMSPTSRDADQMLRWLSRYQPEHKLLRTPRPPYSRELVTEFIKAWENKFAKNPNIRYHLDLNELKVLKLPTDRFANIAGVLTEFDRKMYREDELLDVSCNITRFGIDPLTDFRHHLRVYLQSASTKPEDCIVFVNRERAETIYLRALCYDSTQPIIYVAYHYTTKDIFSLSNELQKPGERFNMMCSETPLAPFNVLRTVLETNQLRVPADAVQKLGKVISQSNWKLSFLMPPQPEPYPGAVVEERLRNQLHCSACKKSPENDPSLVLKPCGNCFSVRYCNTSCQKEDWKKQHRKICKAESINDLKPGWNGWVFKLEEKVRDLYGDQEFLVTLRSGFISWVDPVKKKTFGPNSEKAIVFDPNIYIFDETRRISIAVLPSDNQHVALSQVVKAKGTPYRDDMRGLAVYCKAQRLGWFLLVSKDVVPLKDVPCWWF
jgi:hypothetical protein